MSGYIPHRNDSTCRCDELFELAGPRRFKCQPSAGERPEAAAAAGAFLRRLSCAVQLPRKPTDAKRGHFVFEPITCCHEIGEADEADVWRQADSLTRLAAAAASARQINQASAIVKTTQMPSNGASDRVKRDDDHVDWQIEPARSCLAC